MSATFYPPRQGDLPRGQLEAAANEALHQLPGSEVHFNFTCQHCGERCSLTDPNALYEEGECVTCGKKTMILFGGFSLRMKLRS